MKYLLLLMVLMPLQGWSQASMRRCTLLPITDSVGGAIGFKVFEDVEAALKKSNWCTYVSNSGMMGVFSKYRDSLPQYLKQKEVLRTVAEKLQVGSIVRVSMVNELKGVELSLDVHGEDGEELYFSEKTLITTDEVDVISQNIKNWLETYSKTIPYDAKINGILGEQITLDVGKGYPIQVGQSFIVKRVARKMQHPLLKKIVDWDTEVLAEGKVFNISDNQALGMVKVYTTNKKLIAGDWVRLEPMKQGAFEDKSLDDGPKETAGTLGVLSIAMVTSSSSVDTASSTAGSKRAKGELYGVNFRGEAWITREYFAALEFARTIGQLDETGGGSRNFPVNSNFGEFKLVGGYKYLPIGFFYGPQIDLYAGYANYLFDLDYSSADGYGKGNISGLLLGVGANVPINRDLRFTVQADFIPFPNFKDSDDLYGTAKNASLLDLEIGIKFQLTPRMTLDGSVGTLAGKAKFDSDFKEISYHDNLKLKFGASFTY